MTLFDILLTAHITGGGISLVLGAFVLLAKKGDNRHQVIGIIYFYAMLLAAVTAIALTFLRTNYFLFIVGVFTVYMLVSGKRYLGKKKTADVNTVDWLLTFTMFLFGIAFIGYGLYILSEADNFGIVLLVFGSIGLLFVKRDYHNFRSKLNVKHVGLVSHIQRMVGSYIASATAFLVVNNTILPPILVWLLPTFLLVPFIIKWSRKYTVKQIVMK